MYCYEKFVKIHGIFPSNKEETFFLFKTFSFIKNLFFYFLSFSFILKKIGFITLIVIIKNNCLFLSELVWVYMEKSHCIATKVHLVFDDFISLYQISSSRKKYLLRLKM